MKKIETIHLKPSEIKTNFGNPRKITKEKLKDLENSLEKLGDFGVIVIDENHNVISGNQRLQAMKMLNIDTPVVCKKLIGYSETEKKAINIRANRQSGEWDDDILHNWLQEIKIELGDIDLTGFDTNEIYKRKKDRYFNDIEKINKTYIQSGDVIEIGNHRLLCGDSTDIESMKKLMNEKKWEIVITSPPYNSGKGQMFYNQVNDRKSSDEYYNLCIQILRNCSQYVNQESHTVCWNVAYNSNSRDDYGKIIFSDDNPFRVKETIVWDKGNGMVIPHKAIYTRRCEFIFVMSMNEKYRTTQTETESRQNIYTHATRNTHYHNTDVKHRASYPVELVEHMLKDFSYENDLILDPFLGSGTTMVACHQMNRICYGIELDPVYCQLIIDRMRYIDPELEVKINGVLLKE